MQGIHRATATSGAIAESIDFLTNGTIREIRLHLNAAGASGDLTVKIDSGGGATYDTVLLKQDMTSVTDLHYIPEKPVRVAAGDKLAIAWANAGGKTYGLEVVYSLGWE